MRRVEGFGVPRLVCPTCERTVDPAAAVAGHVVCTGCLRRLDLVALVQELAELVESGVVDPEVGFDLWLLQLDLSAVEREVLDLLLRGYRVNQIAARTGSPVPTVRKRLRRVLAKTGTPSQAELVARCRRYEGAPADVTAEVVVALGAQPAPSAGSARRSRSPRT